MSDKYYWMWREDKKKHELEVEALKSQLHTEREKAQVEILSLEKRLRNEE